MDIDLRCDVGREHAAFLRDRLAAVAALLDEKPDRLGVTVVGDAAMADLHGRHLGDATTTDAMTFELDREGDRVTDGDVVVCLDVAEREAAARGHAVREELLLYAVHGLLHLCGHDDRDAASHAAMHRREDELLAAVGVAARFAAGGGGT